MKLLRGILDSKARRATWKRNNEAPPPAPEQPPARRHDPKPGSIPNTVICCGYTPMSPAAHALHLRGEHLPINCAGVLVSDYCDPWLAEADARLKAARSETPACDDAIKRAEQVDLYYQRQRRREPHKALGASDWMAD